MIACTSLVNEQIQKQAQSQGFDRVIEAPLSAEKMKSIIDWVK
jgi:cellobiose-specific phosphotransferase system component IIB